MAEIDHQKRRAFKKSMTAAEHFESNTPLYIETKDGPVIKRPVRMYKNSDGSIIPTWKTYPVSTKNVSGRKSRRNKKRKSAKRKSAKRKSAKRKSAKRKSAKRKSAKRKSVRRR